ncbi:MULTISPECIES: 1-acyl-sn-glycerol-3-phosphate acyltransferase [unclassified Duganella]|uniref:1-acyl-sn-glycerol-3-phosphate acyltransferase n=1 Tax=unclassified Duganella TaxID=2636909 RepID=UPI000E34FC6B|nr:MULTISPECIES: 1-acyl-sn-glycerol-3-phosphate acyltransferase [unclassified Duganella]RFP16304.1 glycerol acyltransferase [Duganella sp. BJB475]RFP32534.1 glycerol acyltransferase [Duganella sp. BJB476]
MSDFQLKPADLPSWGQRTALRILGLFGWRMLFRTLPGPRGIAVIYPHTSNWDFMIGLFGKWALNLPFRWLAKDSLFKLPVLGKWFRAMGGEPVERGTPSGTIKLQAQRMNAADWYWVGITPEGTRGYRPNWKSGFYHLALEAKVPLVLVYIDYPNKTLGLVDHVFLTGDQEADLAAIRAGFDGHQGLYPANAAPIVLQERRTETRD